MTIAIKVISESELSKVMDWYYEYPKTNPEEFKQLLYSMGMDVTKPMEDQFIRHRNTFNEIVICNRWVGMERVDNEWINSGYASREARNAASGSKLLADMDKFKYKEF